MKNCEKEPPGRGKSIGKGTEVRKVATVPLETQAVWDRQGEIFIIDITDNGQHKAVMKAG